MAAALVGCAELPSLARAVCATVQREVPFSFGCFATTDPTTGLITWAAKTAPVEVGDEEFAATEYGPPDVNRFTDLARRPDPVGILSHDTGGQPSSCRRFRDFLSPRFGFTDELRVVFRSRGASWGALALYRDGGSPDFAVADGRVLAEVHEIVAEAIARVLFSPDVPAPSGEPGPAVLVVDADDRVRSVTPAARREVEDLGGWEHGSLPTSVLSLVALARGAGGAATSRARSLSGRWLTLRAAPLTGGPAIGDMVVTIDVARPAELSGLAFTAHGLTSREQDVTALVLQGVDTRGIAAALHLSPHTVQDHLKSVFTKVGVTSRRELLARLVLT